MITGITVFVENKTITYTTIYIDNKPVHIADN